MAWRDNLEANTKIPSSNNRGSRNNLLLLVMLVILLGTTAVYLLLGALLLCYHTDAPLLLGLITISSRFKTWNAIIPASSSAPFYAFSKSNIELFEKPRHVNIVAVVSYRNPERTSILDCYLQVGSSRSLMPYHV